MMATALLLGSHSAHAYGAGRAPEPTLEELPDGALKKRLSEASTRAKEGGHGEGVIKKPLREALRAHERSRGAAAAGDAPHTTQLVSLAKRWAGVAMVILRAADAEKAATKAQKEAVEFSGKLERAELLLAEQQSRLGRVKAALKAMHERIDKRRKDAAAKEKARATAKPKSKRRGGRR